METGSHNPGSMLIRYMVNDIHMGSIVFRDGGPYHPTTQVHRFGSVATLEQAKELVETHAVHDVMVYPYHGMA